MSITRIRFNDTGVDAGAYTVPINPSSLSLQDSQEQVVNRTLDGGNIIQKSYFDARPYKASWVRIPSDFENFQTMISTLQGYRGEIKYVNFGTADYRVAGAAWEKVRVLNVDVAISSGGNLKYDVTITMSPEP